MTTRRFNGPAGDPRVNALLASPALAPILDLLLPAPGPPDRLPGLDHGPDHGHAPDRDVTPPGVSGAFTGAAAFPDALGVPGFATAAATFPGDAASGQTPPDAVASPWNVGGVGVRTREGVPEPLAWPESGAGRLASETLATPGAFGTLVASEPRRGTPRSAGSVGSGYGAGYGARVGSVGVGATDVGRDGEEGALGGGPGVGDVGVASSSSGSTERALASIERLLKESRDALVTIARDGVGDFRLVAE